WHPSLSEEGFGSTRQVRLPQNEERGPRLVLADAAQSIYLADMNGDGLSDIVRIRNGEVCYWPNLGYGRFGAKVSMRNAPYFDYPEHFDPRAAQLAALSGTGAADLISLGRGGFVAWINLAGNAFGHPQPIDPF